MSSKPTLVCIAGCWHTTEILEPLTKRLAAAGYLDIRSVAPVSTTTTSLQPDGMGDIVAVRAVLEKAILEDAKDVVVVAHSYGGILGSSASKGLLKQDCEAEGKHGGVVRMIFLSGYTLREGESVATINEVRTPEEKAIHITKFIFKVIDRFRMWKEGTCFSDCEWVCIG